MESLESDLAQCFTQLIASAKSHWYGLDIEAQHLEGLSILLDMPSEAYLAMVLALGWVKRFKGRRGVSHPIQKEAVDAFFRSRTLPIELCKAKVASGRKQFWFLRLGPHSNAAFRPVDQFDGRRLQRVSIGRLRLDRLRARVKRLQPTRNDDNTDEYPMAMVDECDDALKEHEERESLRNRLRIDLDRIVDSLPPSDIELIKTKSADLTAVVKHHTSQMMASRVRLGSVALGSKILEPNVDFDPDRFKVLQELGAPIDCRYLAYVVQDILELERLTNSSILSLVKAGNGRQSPCVVIQKNTKKNRSTVDFVLQHSAMTPGSMAVHLLRQDKEGVVEAMRKEGLRLAAVPMSALTTQAMANAGNISDRAMAMIRRFSRQHNQMAMYASQDAVRAISGSKGLVPECRSAMVEKKRLAFSFKRVDQVVLHELTSRVDMAPSVRKVDVIISGDHGKGFYRMVAMLLIWKDDAKPLRVPVEIASMRCRKDTEEVLEAVVPPVRFSLENLYQCRVAYTVNSEVVLVTPDDARFETSIPLRVYMVGDLAWVNDVLGKRNMSGYWCPYCKINKKRRSTATHAKAELWSINSLQEHLQYVENGIGRRKTAQEIMGVVSAPLLPIPLANLIPPVLHMELGLINNIVDFAETWIHALFDPSPSVEMEAARLGRLDCLRKQESTKDALDAFYTGCRLISLTSRLEDLGETLNADEEEELLQLQDEEVELENAFKKANTAWASAKAHETKLAKAFGRLTRPTILRIEEEVYLAWNIRRPSYHGGDFIGTTCRAIMAIAEAVVGGIGDLLLDVPDVDRVTGVTDDAIRQFTAAICQLLQYADAIFAIARKGEQEITQVDRENCAQYIPLFCRLWRVVGLPTTIKFHILEDHLLDRLGNGERLEDATEQQHQISYSFEQRNRISDYKKKVKVASRHEAVRNHPKLKEEKERVLLQTSRPKRREMYKEKIEHERKRRRGERLHLLDANEVEVFPLIDSILLEQLLALVGERAERNG
jgi:hypothetical protein